jgi:predicted ATPase/DNA-binding SARP family transcriptional activator/DNA-binding CsgD family transcriptional regulator
VRVRLLGGFEVSVGSRTVEADGWRRRKAESLVKILALARDHRLHRRRVTELLWPDLDEGSASNEFHRALHFARRALDSVASGNATRYLPLVDGTLALCPEEPLWVDAEEFESAAAVARRVREPAAYRAAIELYAGELLPGDRYEDWTQERRYALRETHLELLVELAAVYEERGEDGPAVGALGRVLTEDPAREEAHRALMRLHAARGDCGRAVAQYGRIARALEPDEVPGEATRRLHEEIRAGNFPAAPTPQFQEPSISAPNNLPASLTSFVGRETEMVDIRRDLSMTRLLTLTGAGGSGKTRLASEVARGLVGIHPDGVWFVELASLSDPELVPGAVAQTLGVREQPGQPLTRALAAHLRSGQTLLILDNCEHVVEAAASLVNDLLKSCPKLKVLATSREPLGVPGESVRPVPPLAVPAAEDGAPTAESVMLREAVRLFVERARSRLPDFEVTAENAGSVARVCRKLDGIPLAIELAAARMGALAVEQVAQRLEGSLKLLTGGARTVETRHRTLRATLDWSHDLLDEAERALFRRLSVFAGGWTLEAAERVDSGSGIEGEDVVLDLLSRLVAKSLVVAEEKGGASRYRMLETVRQYGHERLEESGEAERVRERHARYFLEFAQDEDAAEAAGRQVIDARPVAWVGRMEGEHANLAAALNWSLGDDAGAAEVGVRLAVALFWFWQAHHSEGRRRLERAARATSDPATARWRARASHGASWLALYQADPGAAKIHVEEAVALYREARDEEGIAIGLVQFGILGVIGGRDDVPVAAVLEELGERKPGLKNRTTLGYLLMLEGLVALSRGDLGLSAALHEESLELLREIGDTQGMISALVNLAAIALARGDHEGAEPLLREALLLGRDTDMKSVVQHCLYGLGCVAAGREHPARAARLWGAMDGIRERHGLHLTPLAFSLTGYEGRLAAAREAIGEEMFAAAWEEGKAMPLDHAIEYALGAEEPSPRKVAESPPLVPADLLTRRQREVAILIGRGLTNARIAEELGISKHTVANHVASILDKLDLPSRSRIAVWVTATEPKDPE